MFFRRISTFSRSRVLHLSAPRIVEIDLSETNVATSITIDIHSFPYSFQAPARWRKTNAWLCDLIFCFLWSRMIWTYEVIKVLSSSWHLTIVRCVFHCTTDDRFHVEPQKTSHETWVISLCMKPKCWRSHKIPWKLNVCANCRGQEIQRQLRCIRSQLGDRVIDNGNA